MSYEITKRIRLTTEADSFFLRNTSFSVTIDENLDAYTSLAKFLEQAFEWNVMDYTFYPYYWAENKHWKEMYLSEELDPLFRNFLQAGMARVIVTVRPGFEDAVNFYMATGKIWNGGEVPVIGEPLYLSIIDEMRQPLGKKCGKAWPSRIPTSLTILQAKSIGLNVTKALPFDDNLSDFENPEEVPQSKELETTDAQIGIGEQPKTGSLFGNITGSNGKFAEIMLKNKDKSPVDFTQSDALGDWSIENIPVGKYELNLDENGDFPDTEYQILEGQLIRVVEIKENQATEINVTLQKV